MCPHLMFLVCAKEQQEKEGKEGGRTEEGRREDGLRKVGGWTGEGRKFLLPGI